jgi:hypothetical protein
MEAALMKTVTLDVATREEVTRRALEVFKGKKQRARISFCDTRTALEGAHGQAVGGAQGHGGSRASHNP